MSKIAALLIIVFLFMILTPSGMAFCAEAGFKPHFSVRLLGGLSYQNIDDLNSGSSGLSNLMCLLISYIPHGAQYGDFQPVHFGLDLGVDLIYQFDPNWGIGIGGGFLHASKKSEIQFIEERPPYRILDTFAIEPSVSVVPISANLFLFVPIDSFLIFSINIGPAIYIASISQDVRTEYVDWWWHQKETATGLGFGVQAGIGIDVRLFSNISIILDIQGRAATAPWLAGTHHYINSYGTEETIEGNFYYWTDTTYGVFRFPHMPFPLVGVKDGLPSGQWINNPRKGTLDISGGSVRAGLAFRF